MFILQRNVKWSTEKQPVSLNPTDAIRFFVFTVIAASAQSLLVTSIVLEKGGHGCCLGCGSKAMTDREILQHDSPHTPVHLRVVTAHSG